MARTCAVCGGITTATKGLAYCDACRRRLGAPVAPAKRVVAPAIATQPSRRILEARDQAGSAEKARTESARFVREAWVGALKAHERSTAERRRGEPRGGRMYGAHTGTVTPRSRVE
jgi:hypothetical protein